jgi:predicted 2-oxoglutarate/Fe(II)-dependent dioxygenase YbiX
MGRPICTWAGFSKARSRAEQASLPTHQDENTFSFTIALNDRSEYQGGGTCFEGLRPAGAAPTDPFTPHVLNADAGGVVTFPGKLRHGGSTVTKGRRYIIPLFIYSDRNRSGAPPGYVLRGLV